MWWLDNDGVKAKWKEVLPDYEPNEVELLTFQFGRDIFFLCEKYKDDGLSIERLKFTLSEVINFLERGK